MLQKLFISIFLLNISFCYAESFTELQLKMAYVEGYCDGILKVGEVIREPSSDLIHKIADCEQVQKFYNCLKAHDDNTLMCEKMTFSFSEPISILKIKSLFNLQ